MHGFSDRLRQQARTLQLSDAEVARRAGLSERRYGNYVAGIREPDLGTLMRIATALSTTPNILLGVEDAPRRPDERGRHLARLLGAAECLSTDEVERLVIQVEALAHSKSKHRRR
jgi:transcriptional regulator with XRE-family HTH domain